MRIFYVRGALGVVSMGLMLWGVATMLFDWQIEPVAVLEFLTGGVIGGIGWYFQPIKDPRDLKESG